MDVKEFKIKWYKGAVPESSKLYLVTKSTGQVFMAQCCSWMGSENGDYWNVLIYLTDPSGKEPKAQLAMEQCNIEPDDVISCVNDILYPGPIGDPEDESKWYKGAVPESGKLYLVTKSTGQVFMAQCCSWMGSGNGDYWNVLIYLTDPSGKEPKAQLAMEQCNIEPDDVISCVNDILYPGPIGDPEDESKWSIVRRLSELQDAMKGCTCEIKELRQLFFDLHDMVKQLQPSGSTVFIAQGTYPQDPGVWPSFPQVWYRTNTGFPPPNEQHEIK